MLWMHATDNTCTLRKKSFGLGSLPLRVSSLSATNTSLSSRGPVIEGFWLIRGGVGQKLSEEENESEALDPSEQVASRLP